ncbi:AraC family transcriptional regulator [Mucilaginibacter galii]|uniref:AraC family transcriptional regulator n=1 Tax=Mucilaginibacter galii TaxID=2005073 RepID=A0A917JD37_9SPHI|nr:AraC family transcriptional regulator [Mucilaginibacter galii]GGI52230.1 AraC family transcriptional regulator [Mucilaginibacter galii]
MKPQLLKVATGSAHSFSVRRDVVPFFNNKWHYHAEVELIYLEKGAGTQFVGDSIQNFNDGDVILIGSNLPHYWRFNKLPESDKESGVADVSVVHFSDTFWGNSFLQLPETKLIKNLLDRAKRGVQITGETRIKVAGLIQKMLNADSVRRLILLLETLEAIAESNEVEYLSSVGFVPNLEQSENDRVNAIYEYSFSNYRNKIALKEIAMVANISPNSFCRYFKTHTGKTYSGFLLEYKVGIACKLLIEDKLSIQQICYESGFNNFASFHKYFKKLTGKTPLAYQKEFIYKKA